MTEVKFISRDSEPAVFIAMGVAGGIADYLVVNHVQAPYDSAQKNISQFEGDIRTLQHANKIMHQFGLGNPSQQTEHDFSSRITDLRADIKTNQNHNLHNFHLTGAEQGLSLVGSFVALGALGVIAYNRIRLRSWSVL